MAETIKLVGTSIPEVDYEVENLSTQLEHKENVLKKAGGYNGTIDLTNVSEITVVNGQIVGVKE